jgi:hypothetical protein
MLTIHHSVVCMRLFSFQHHESVDLSPHVDRPICRRTNRHASARSCRTQDAALCRAEFGRSSGEMQTYVHAHEESLIEAFVEPRM